MSVLGATLQLQKGKKSTGRLKTSTSIKIGSLLCEISWCKLDFKKKIAETEQQGLAHEHPISNSLPVSSCWMQKLKKGGPRLQSLLTFPFS